MSRLVLAAALSILSSVCSAAAYNPTVAYTQASGRSQDLYLVNADGSHAMRVATGSGGINGVDFAPGGGRIAFSDKAGLKVLTFTASDTGIQVAGVQLLVGLVNGPPGPPDFSPDGTRIIYLTSSNSSPNTVRVVTVPGGVEELAYQCYACDGPRWLRADVGNAFAFLRYNFSVSNSPSREIWTALINADNTVTAGPLLSTTTQVFKGIEDFDTARTRNSLLVTANYPDAMRTVEVDIVTRAVTDKGNAGSYHVHYSANDSRIVSLDAYGYYVKSLDLVTGLVTRLTTTKKGIAIDAQP